MKPSAETLRQLVHISAILFALTFRFLSAPWAFFLATCAFIHNTLILPKYAPHLFREREHLLQGIAVYPMMVALLILLFPHRLVLAGGAWAILALGDGVSTLVGKRQPLVYLPWNPDKSLGGLLAFIIAGSLGAYLVMSWIGPAYSHLHVLMVAVCAATVAGIYETVPLPWDDNVVVALIAAGMCAVVWNLDVSLATRSITAGWWGVALSINAGAALLAWWFHLVSTTGALGGTLIGTVIMVMGGSDLFVLLLIFFLGASAATRVGYHEKSIMGVAQESGGRRGAKHALANCILALMAAVLLGMTDGADTLLVVVFCAALATAFGDSVSSELGQVYGKEPFLPSTFRRVRPGTVGAISIEGTLFGMGAVAIFALAAFFLSILPIDLVPAVIIGGWFGFYAESYIGAIWTEEGIEVDNEWMNVLNTFIGSTLALVAAQITSSW